MHLSAFRTASILLVCLLPAAADDIDPMRLIRSAVENYMSDLHRLTEYSYRVDEEDREYDIRGKMTTRQRITFDILVSAGKVYWSVVDPREEPPVVIKELPPFDLYQMTTGAPGMPFGGFAPLLRIPFQEIPQLYRVRKVRDTKFAGRPEWLIHLSPRTDVPWPKKLQRHKITMNVDKMDTRFRRLVYTGTNKKMTIEFAITHGTWLIHTEDAEIVRGLFPHRVHYETLYTYTYKKFSASTRILPSR